MASNTPNCSQEQEILYPQEKTQKDQRKIGFITFISYYIKKIKSYEKQDNWCANLSKWQTTNH
jgi:hypothetical protein